ncbi:ead/Ea22-like family protein [Klebsiella pneumoniae]|uniref:ead/Ea22-like family protein n=1 Tax=Klebsiella pneumoniae TaxID=573 RepID=UPI001BCD9C38|nr:ead/Ea22-like family protein [Klebsiella pneumoniae]MBS4569114.1 ead/Ea22-like family protein [Klebsiella pneumoniae]MBS4585472.1 ead/Ea22-like family protein [Klebsiella pneumoniae]
MTITLQTVNELIASLESAGELSIREQKFLKLAKAYQQLAAENVALKQAESNLVRNIINDLGDTEFQYARVQTPATDRILAGIKADGRVEGAHFVANRMLAAWDAGFIEDTAKNAADIARMILTSTEFMADAPEGDFDRSFADGILEDIAKQLREGANHD